MKEFVTILSVVTGAISIANMLLSVFGKSFLAKEILVSVTQRPAFARLLVIVILDLAFVHFFEPFWIFFRLPWQG